MKESEQGKSQLKLFRWIESMRLNGEFSATLAELEEDPREALGPDVAALSDGEVGVVASAFRSSALANELRESVQLVGGDV